MTLKEILQERKRESAKVQTDTQTEIATTTNENASFTLTFQESDFSAIFKDCEDF
jgi:hypothetical protein